MRLLFVGLDNPQSSDPRHALYPSPAGCAGHRLLEIIREADPDFTTAMYHRIPKTNLFPVGRMPKEKQALSRAADLLIAQLASGTSIVLMGKVVYGAVFREYGDKFEECVFVTIDHGVRCAWIPHPSGRNRYYNDARARRRVGKFLREVIASCTG